MRPNLTKVTNLFSPDENGVSDWVTVAQVIEAGLKWTSNGNVRRGVAFNVSEFHWEFDKVKNKIERMRLIGTNDELAFQQRIRKDIIDELRQQTKSNFAPDCIVDLIDNDKEIDHRWGRKDDPQFIHIGNVKNQSVDDFQLLSHSHNQLKRQKCKECVETNVRFDGQTYTTCLGCPLAQPELYRLEWSC